MAHAAPVTARTGADEAGPGGSGAGLLAWAALAILLVLAFTAFLDRQIVSLMVGLIRKDLGLTDGHIGVLQGAAFGLAYPLFAIPLGYAADRWSRRYVILAGVLFWSMAAVASGLAGSFSTLLAARIGVGIGEAALGPAAASLLSDLFPRRRLALVFSIYSCGSLLGSAGALAIGGAIISLAGDGVDLPLVGHLAPWQFAFVATGLPGLALAFLVLLIREPPRTGARANGAPWGEVFDFARTNIGFLVPYTLGFTCLMIVTWGGLAWTPAILERSYGWSVAQVGASLGLFTAILGLSGQLSNGALVDHMFSRGAKDAHLRYYVGGCVIITACGVLAPLAPGAWAYLAIMAPWKFLMNYGGVFSAALQVATPAPIRGRMAAICGTVSAMVGGAAGPSVIAAFTDHVFHDDTAVIRSLALATGIFVPLAGLLFWVGMKPMRRAVEQLEAA